MTDYIPETVSTRDPRFTIEEKSEKLSFNWTDGKKIARGAVVAIIGAIAAWATATLVPSISDDPEIVASLVAMFSVIANALKKYISGI